MVDVNSVPIATKTQAMSSPSTALPSQAGSDHAAASFTSTTAASAAAKNNNNNGSSSAGAAKASIQLQESKPTLTEDVIPADAVSFESLGLSLNLSKITHKVFKWDHPSPIQQQAIPPILESKNVVLRAKTGTGKTGCFVLPILDKINLKDRSSIEALILVPTRELSMQTSNLFISLSKHLKFEKNESSDESENSSSHHHVNYPKTLLLTGGINLNNHISILRDHANQGIKIIVGTCGRIIELINKKYLNLDQLKIIALDEADKMMSSSNIHNIERILSECPKDSQKILLSATYHEEISSHVSRLVENPHFVNVMDNLTLKGIKTYYCYIEEKKKLQALVKLYSRMKITQLVIFVSSSQRAKNLCSKLNENGITCSYIDSKMTQQKRNEVFNDFKQNSNRVIICTDIFERGIDNPRVNCVINFDIPQCSKTYLHRAGRAGRYGRKGLTVDMVNETQQEKYVKILKDLRIIPDCFPETIDDSLYQNYF